MPSVPVLQCSCSPLVGLAKTSTIDLGKRIPPVRGIATVAEAGSQGL